MMMMVFHIFTSTTLHLQTMERFELIFFGAIASSKWLGQPASPQMSQNNANSGGGLEIDLHVHNRNLHAAANGN
jgi:hypothetical protein